MTESDLQREIMLAVSKTGARIFRNNTGQGWVGTIVAEYVSAYGREIILRNPRPLHAGLCGGSSDLIGWTTAGQFLAIEVKAKRGRATKEQANFVELVGLAGGIGIVARSVDEVLEVLR